MAVTYFLKGKLPIRKHAAYANDAPLDSTKANAILQNRNF